MRAVLFEELPALVSIGQDSCWMHSVDAGVSPRMGIPGNASPPVA